MRCFLDWVRTKGNLVVVIANVLLIGFIGWLVAANYLSERELRKSALEHLRLDMEKRTTAVSYFFSERENDLKDLAEGRAISAFFENKALGMSMEYGLRAGLLGISGNFDRFLMDRKIEKDRIYTRMALIDSTGQLLVDRGLKTAKQEHDGDWKKLLTPESLGSAITVRHDGQVTRIMVSIPYFFKHEFAGQIVAWISPQTVYHFVEVSKEFSKRSVYIICKKHSIPLLPDIKQWTAFSGLPDFSNLEIDKPQRIEVPHKDGTKADIVAIQLMVKHTPFSFVAFLPASELLGHIGLWHLPLAMGVLAIILLGGTAIAFWINMQNMVLQARLEESSKREQEIKKKNRQLNKEISERRCTEELLKKAHNELEKRVEERTSELVSTNERLQTEIYERKHTEKTLRAEREQLLSIFSSISQIIYIADPKTYEILYANGALKEAFKKDLVGRLCYKEFQGLDSPCEFCTNKIILKEKYNPYQWEYHNPILNRDHMLIDRIIKWPDGRDVRFEIGIDITEAKRAEEEKKKLEAQLVRAQKMEAIGTLAGGVAHDLNNILSGLVSYPELLLLDLPKDSPLRKPILTIKESGQKAAAIVLDLLTLARRGLAVKEVVNLDSIVSEYLTSPEYEKLKDFHPNVTLQTDLETDLLNILGSPVHLSKTVMNLHANAAEAMPDGGTISISTKNRYIDGPIRGYDHVKEGDYVTLKISDTGVGIPSEDIERIFEPFYTKKVMGRSGTGLGMAVVWGTIKDHKGYIDIKSSEGNGTTFTLYFPVTRKDLPKEKSRLSIEDYMGKGEAILVVDDVEEQRGIASGMLEKLGYSVKSVSSGEGAVDYMKGNSADLLVLDMIMDPGIDGLETYKRILEVNPGQKAIIASGFTETEQVKEAKRLGAGTYIKKPYLIEEIGLAVKAELDN